MKKLVLTIAIVLGMTFGAVAQNNGGGLFQRGNTPDNASGDGGNSPMLPAHGQSTNQSASETPVGGGALLLIGFGAAYAMVKKRKE